ncbi:MAG: hypothetical protein QME87_01950 [Bacillota bacterium]|nr:hypothetical protein [Bacillota bacterium]
MSRDIPIEFRPGGAGLGKVLGGLEAEVMEVAWSRGRVTARRAPAAARQATSRPGSTESAEPQGPEERGQG